MKSFSQYFNFGFGVFMSVNHNHHKTRDSLCVPVNY